MFVKMILPALTEARSNHFRPIKYSLFPPLGLATLAGYLPEDEDIEIIDEHVEKINLCDNPDLVVIQVYITNAYRAYELGDYYRKKGAHVVMGGLHVTTMPKEALEHADTVMIGPGEDIWPRFIRDFYHGKAESYYVSVDRSLYGVPFPRRDILNRSRYLVPNSIVVSRGCPHSCDFCYKDSFFMGGKSFYTCSVDRALSEIESLPGSHLFFLDDNIFADRRFALDLFEGMKGMGRVWQAAGTVKAILDDELLNAAVESGLKSLFVGLESINDDNMKLHNKTHNAGLDYSTAIKRLHERNVMINGSFVFGMDSDDRGVFSRTVDWAIKNGVETATFHILTPYPGTKLYKRLDSEGRIVTKNWDFYDTRHAVFQPANMSMEELEAGYWQSYKRFYKYSSIMKAAFTKEGMHQKLRHLTYTMGWKKFEPAWNLIIKLNLLGIMRPLLETVLDGFSGKRRKPRPGHREEVLTLAGETRT